jgi:hypothetical protein
MNDSGDSYMRSATQISSYISVVTSFASMMLALLLRRQHRPRERGTAKEVVRCALVFIKCQCVLNY